MANNQTNVKAINQDGQTFHVQHTSTDSPILPAANLAQLHELDPSLVTFVVEQTAKEAEHRRKQESRINTFIFTEKLAGVLMGALITFFVFGIGGYLILKGHDTAGVGICGAGLVSIVALFVNRQNNQTRQITSVNPGPPARKPRAAKPKKLPPNS
jgi:hypothetical protein